MNAFSMMGTATSMSFILIPSFQADAHRGRSMRLSVSVGCSVSLSGEGGGVTHGVVVVGGRVLVVG